MYSLSEISNKWQPLAPFLSVPHTEVEYDNLSAFLDQLIDDIGNDESHPLAALMDTVGTLIEAYDEEHFPFSEGNPLDVLKYLIKKHHLSQSDLPELGSQGVVKNTMFDERRAESEFMSILRTHFNNNSIRTP